MKITGTYRENEQYPVIYYGPHDPSLGDGDNEGVVAICWGRVGGYDRSLHLFHGGHWNLIAFRGEKGGWDLADNSHNRGEHAPCRAVAIIMWKLSR